MNTCAKTVKRSKNLWKLSKISLGFMWYFYIPFNGLQVICDSWCDDLWLTPSIKSFECERVWVQTLQNGIYLKLLISHWIESLNHKGLCKCDVNDAKLVGIEKKSTRIRKLHHITDWATVIKSFS